MTIEADSPGRKPDCVVIDTNTWRSELLLKSPMGVSFVYTLGRQGGFIGLPEVVESELTTQVVQMGLKATEECEKWSRIVGTLTDLSFFPTLPTKTKLEEIVNERIAELARILIRIPFTLDHAKAALDMVNAKLPPNGQQDQQFKDSAIWQAVLTLSEKYAVHLVTNDRAFLLDRKDPSQGLAANLQDDCRRVAVSVNISCDLGSCLKAISSDIPTFDRERLSSLIAISMMPGLLAEATRQKFKIGKILGTEITAFKTGTGDRLAVDYTVAAQCDRDSSDQSTDCRAIIRGSCYYSPQADSLAGDFIEYITFEWKYPGGGFGRVNRSWKIDDPSIPFPRPVIWG